MKTHSPSRVLSAPVAIGGILLLVIAAAFASISVSASRSVSRISTPSAGSRIKGKVGPTSSGLQENHSRYNTSGLLSLLMAPPSLDEAVATYQVVADLCTATAKTTFILGDKVCVRVENAPLRAGAPLRRLNFTGPKGFVRDMIDVTTDPQESIFTLPTDNTSVIDGLSIDNRGTWSASSNSTSDGGTRAIAYFNVSDPDNAAADLVVYDFSTENDVITAGSNTGFLLWLSNSGPDGAANVDLSMAVPANMSYLSASTSSGFACAETTGVVHCTVASWASGAVATITLNFMVSAGAPNGVISSTANISSDTNDPRTASNTSSAKVEIRSAGAPPATCALGCPADRVVTATSPSGAVVNFGAGDIEVSGDCGTITFSPASGSLFAVGTTPVQVSSGGGTGGSCSFTVTVIDTAPPTIACPLGDLTAAAPSGQASATVAVTPPAATGTGVSVSGVRSDSQIRNDDGTFVSDLSDPYPIGTTIITWTATDSDQRTASCTQKVIVTSVDAPTISCPSDKTFDAGGNCQITLTALQIGTPTTGGASSPPIDPCPVSNPCARRSDNLALLDPYPAGTTTITWTYANSLGSASCTQVITITASGDTTPPTLTMPPDVSVTTATCSALVDDELGAATATDTCSAVSIVRTGVPLSEFPNGPIACPTIANPGRRCIENFNFPVGTTDVTYKATDAAGNQATGVQHVTVHETSPPVFTFVPSNVGPINNDAGLCGAFVGDATLGTATVSDNCDTTVIRTGVPAGNIFPVGDTTITYTAKADLSVTRTQHVIVVDNTLPVVTPPAAVTLYTGTGATSCGVTVTDLNGTFGIGSATDNCPGVSSVTRSGVPSGNVFPLGQTTLTYSATDAHGNTGSADQIVTVVDNTPPSINCPANLTVYLPLNSTATSMVVNYPAATASDNCPGSVGITYSQNSGTVFPVGPTTVTATATDAHSNSSSCQFTVTVLYDFTGFFSPVGNPPVLNAVKAGQAVPVKFSLSGNKGLNIFAANNPYSVSLNCATNDPGVDITETVTAGGSSLSYGGDQYNYVWKTESSWAGTCRQLVITLNDGSVHVANFKFK